MKHFTPGMKKYFLALCLVAAAVRCQTIPEPSATPQGFTKLMVGQVKHLQNSGSSTKRYRSTLAYREYDDDDSYDGLDKEIAYLTEMHKITILQMIDYGDNTNAGRICSPISRKISGVAADISRYQNQMHPYKLVPINELAEDDFDRRILFCEQMMQMIDDNTLQIENVLFSDESTFTLHGNVNRQNCRYWSRKSSLDEDSAPESSQDRAPTLVNQNYPVPLKSTLQPVANYQQRPNNAQRVYQVPAALIKPGNRPQPHLQPFPSRSVQDANKLEEEKEEPDRLSLLLPQSKFSCTGKHTGYYSDEFLGCEVFHYCQDNARHSWICPEGFTFHQVHLICMPPGGDNICEKSSDFHFVNDFLYKPVNLEEYQQRPNVTLKYSDRYFPNSYGHYTEDGEGVASNYKHSVRVTQQPHVQTVAAVSRPQVATVRPQATTGQVYRNPEDINIPPSAEEAHKQRPVYNSEISRRLLV
ncbi:hypothetical protein NQ318_005375 [Aromia moschata]|uniref:Chitin-binding type-2 domain-containing protein n=1 Tax=Aromia moschata TaxID=1265417 RepID=A0AAV8YYN0_9CUCU|nr:hypothetical protein NQ318_005375 [Aromia moschata]